MMKQNFLSLVVATGLTILAGCGGGGGESPNHSGLSAVKVMGDSLSDLSLIHI